MPEPAQLLPANAELWKLAGGLAVSSSCAATDNALGSSAPEACRRRAGVRRLQTAGLSLAGQSQAAPGAEMQCGRRGPAVVQRLRPAICPTTPGPVGRSAAEKGTRGPGRGAGVPKPGRNVDAGKWRRKAPDPEVRSVCYLPARSASGGGAENRGRGRSRPQRSMLGAGIGYSEAIRRNTLCRIPPLR